jgi:hypothetical protein
MLDSLVQATADAPVEACKMKVISPESRAHGLRD